MHISGEIHYDVNESNVLVRCLADGESEIVGLIDFQDAAHGCKIYDVAICIMYSMLLSDKPVDVGGYCLQGYLEKRTLSQPELNVLYYCVVGRLVISLLLGLHNYSCTPDPYYLDTQKSGWKVLRLLWALPSEEVLQHWLSTKL